MYFINDNDLLKKSKALKYIQKMIFIASLVLLLIIKLRFPKGKSIHRETNFVTENDENPKSVFCFQFQMVEINSFQSINEPAQTNR